MRKSLLVLALWVPLDVAILPQPSLRLDQLTQQAIQCFLLYNRTLDSPQNWDNTPHDYNKKQRF